VRGTHVTILMLQVINLAERGKQWRKRSKRKKVLPLLKEKRGKRKWVGRILKFLMYGGWLLVLIFVLGIVILFSTLGK
jgi:hypothetical protein